MVTAKLICVFVFAFAKSRFSHDTAHIVQLRFTWEYIFSYFCFHWFFVHVHGLHTVKFLNFRTLTNFIVNTNIQTKRFYHGVIPLYGANGKANSEDPVGAV